MLFALPFLVVLRDSTNLSILLCELGTLAGKGDAHTDIFCAVQLGDFLLCSPFLLLFPPLMNIPSSSYPSFPPRSSPPHFPLSSPPKSLSNNSISSSLLPFQGGTKKPRSLSLCSGSLNPILPLLLLLVPFPPYLTCPVFPDRENVYKK